MVVQLANGALTKMTLESESLPKGVKETYIVVTKNNPAMVLLAQNLRHELDTRFGLNNTIVLEAVDEFRAAKIADAHHPIAVVGYVLNGADEAQHRNLRDALDHGGVQRFCSIVNPALDRETGDLRSVTSENYPNIINDILQSRQDVNPARVGLFNNPSLEEVLADKETRFREQVKSLKRQGAVETVFDKVGGSIADLIAAGVDPELGLQHQNSGLEIYRQLVIAKAALTQNYNFVTGVGGGPLAEKSRAFARITQTAQTAATRGEILGQAELHQAYLREAGVQADLIEQPNSATILPMLKQNSVNMHPNPALYIILHLPRGGESGQQEVQMDQSDLLSVATASRLEIPNLYFLKDTDGIYTVDPHINNVADRETLPKPLQEFEEQNKFIPRIYASDVLGGRISRSGFRGGEEHLIEDDALRFMIENPNLSAIYIVSGRHPERLEALVTGGLVDGKQPVHSVILNDLYHD